MNVTTTIVIYLSVVLITICTCLVSVPPATFTMEASKPKTGFVNSTITLMLDSFVMLGELVLNMTPGFTESKRKT
jgi:hypothetical protein